MYSLLFAYYQIQVSANIVRCKSLGHSIFKHYFKLCFIIQFDLSKKKVTYYIRHHFSDKKHNESSWVLLQIKVASAIVKVSRGTGADSPRLSVKISHLFTYKTLVKWYLGLLF